MTAYFVMFLSSPPLRYCTIQRSPYPLRNGLLICFGCFLYRLKIIQIEANRDDMTFGLAPGERRTPNRSSLSLRHSNYAPALPTNDICVIHKYRSVKTFLKCHAPVRLPGRSAHCAAGPICRGVKRRSAAGQGCLGSDGLARRLVPPSAGKEPLSLVLPLLPQLSPQRCAGGACDT